MSWAVPVGAEQTSAIVDQGAGDTVFICAHGAGGNKLDRAVAATARELVGRGLSVVRFNFLYRENGASRPDPMPRLTQTIAAVVAHTRAALNPARIIIGGRSMGGRAASMLAAEGFAADGLLLLAYPLHPPGQPDKLRDAHLPAIAMPTLCINGTRDTFCTPALMDRVMTRVGPNWRMHWVEGADHSFHVRKATGRHDADVLREIGDTTMAWWGADPSLRQG